MPSKLGGTRQEPFCKSPRFARGKFAGGRVCEVLGTPKTFKAKMDKAIRYPKPRGVPHGAPAPLVWESGGALHAEQARRHPPRAFITFLFQAKIPPRGIPSAGSSYSFHQSIWARSSSADRGDRSAGATSKTVRQPVRPLCFMRYTARAKATIAEAVNSGLESSRRL